MAEVNLLAKLPRGKRNVNARAEAKTQEIIDISRQYGELYFDGPRKYGYGGYRYDGRWKVVAQQLIDHYQLGPNARILDVGCGKAHLLHELKQLLPNADVTGFDVSQHGLADAPEPIRPYLFRTAPRIHIRGATTISIWSSRLARCTTCACSSSTRPCMRSSGSAGRNTSWSRATGTSSSSSTWNAGR